MSASKNDLAIATRQSGWYSTMQMRTKSERLKEAKSTTAEELQRRNARRNRKPDILRRMPSSASIFKFIRIDIMTCRQSNPFQALNSPFRTRTFVWASAALCITRRRLTVCAVWLQSSVTHGPREKISSRRACFGIMRLDRMIKGKAPKTLCERGTASPVESIDALKHRGLPARRILCHAHYETSHSRFSSRFDSTSAFAAHWRHCRFSSSIMNNWMIF